MRYELNFDEDKIIDIEAIGDNSVLDLKDCCKLLNELNEERNYFERKKCEYFNKYNKKHLDNIQLKEENKKLIEEWEFSFRTEMAHHRFAEKELQEKIREKQATINKLKEENEQLKQKIQRWKNLYEIKDAEVTARVDALNKVCEYYTSEVLFKSDTDPNRAVKEVLNEILNTEVKK